MGVGSYTSNNNHVFCGGWDPWALGVSNGQQLVPSVQLSLSKTQVSFSQAERERKKERYRPFLLLMTKFSIQPLAPPSSLPSQSRPASGNHSANTCSNGSSALPFRPISRGFHRHLLTAYNLTNQGESQPILGRSGE